MSNPKNQTRTAKPGNESPPPKHPRTRHATVYDAVAGRSGTNGFLYPIPLTTGRENSRGTSGVPLPPDEVLFKRKNAPVRYEEDDIYFANRRLSPHQKLPDSDLLKAIHTYTSDFYASAPPHVSSRVWRSMDETALLAMGILLEEAAVDTLGETGDLPFVEGDEDGDLPGHASVWNGTKWVRSVIARAPSKSKRPKKTRRTSLVGSGESMQSALNKDSNAQTVESD